SSAQAGDDRRDSRRRAVQRRVEDQNRDSRTAVESVYRGQREQAGCGQLDAVAAAPLAGRLIASARAAWLHRVVRSRRCWTLPVASGIGLPLRCRTTCMPLSSSKAIMALSFSKLARRGLSVARFYSVTAALALLTSLLVPQYAFALTAADVAPLAGDDFDAK